MMAALAASVPYALALALSSAPIVIMALVLVTTRPRAVSTMFLLGWATGITLFVGLIVGFVDTEAPRNSASVTGSVVRLVLGMLVGALAFRSWRARAGAEDVPPKWISGTASWSAARAFQIGVALGGLNPKTIALGAAGATVILGATPLLRDQVLAAVAFGLVGSLGVAVPVVLQAAGGAGVKQRLERARAWTEPRGRTISTVVLAAIATVLIGRGLTGLLA